ncbi:hypothetical protein L9F63_017182, partial [Diploptera punctata]
FYLQPFAMMLFFRNIAAVCSMDFCRKILTAITNRSKSMSSVFPIFESWHRNLVIGKSQYLVYTQSGHTPSQTLYSVVCYSRLLKHIRLHCFVLPAISSFLFKVFLILNILSKPILSITLKFSLTSPFSQTIKSKNEKRIFVPSTDRIRNL